MILRRALHIWREKNKNAPERTRTSFFSFLFSRIMLPRKLQNKYFFNKPITCFQNTRRQRRIIFLHAQSSESACAVNYKYYVRCVRTLRGVRSTTGPGIYRKITVIPSRFLTFFSHYGSNGKRKNKINQSNLSDSEVFCFGMSRAVRGYVGMSYFDQVK